MSLATHARNLALCTFCPKLCRFSCPTAEVERRETVTPWGKMTLAEMIRTVRLEAGGAPAETLLHCLGCLHCQEYCVHQVDVPAALYAGRSEARPAALDGVLERFQRTGNPWGEPLREALLKAVDQALLVPEAQAVLFPGCQALRAADRHLRPLFHLLEILAVDVVGVHTGEVLCCGAPLLQAGSYSLFRSHAERLARELRTARQVICPCPTCAYFLGAVFLELGVRLKARIVTLDEFLEPLFKARPPRQRLSDPVAVHDPCFLARHLRRPDGIVQLVAPALAVLPARPSWHGRDTICCGGGGLVTHTLPAVARAVALRRAEQLAQTGARRVVTGCPGCLRELEPALETRGVACTDAVELLLEAYAL